jgi:geranylgeranyl pyrophosphate synthase
MKNKKIKIYKKSNNIKLDILNPVYDYIDRGGKRIRPVLSILLGECF